MDVRKQHAILYSKIGIGQDEFPGCVAVLCGSHRTVRCQRVCPKVTPVSESIGGPNKEGVEDAIESLTKYFPVRLHSIVWTNPNTRNYCFGHSVRRRRVVCAVVSICAAFIICIRV